MNREPTTTRTSKILKRYRGKLRHTFIFHNGEWKFSQVRISRKMVAKLIRQQYGIQISVHGVGKCVIYRTHSGQLTHRFYTKIATANQ